MANRQHANAMDYLIRTSPPTLRLNPRKFEVVYTNRYDTVISSPHQSLNAAVIEVADLSRQGIEAIIKDVSAMIEDGAPVYA